MVHSCRRYMSGCTPRVYGYWPGSPSRSGSSSGRSASVYRGLISMPESVNRRGSSGPTMGAIVRCSSVVAIVTRTLPPFGGWTGRLGSRPVDLRMADRETGDAPFGQHRGVLPVGDDRLQRGEDGGREARPLGDRDPVDRVGVRLADELELTGRLLDLIGRHRRVGEAELGAAAGEREVGSVLIVELENGDRGLACLGAGRALCLGVCDLGGALLDRHRLAADVGDARDVRAARGLR